MNATKLEICSRVSKRTNTPVVEIKPIFESILDEILAILSEGDRIELRGFGAFRVKDRKKRVGRNPRTGQLVDIPSHKIPVFKFSKDGLKIFGDKTVTIKKPVKHKAESSPKTPEKILDGLVTESPVKSSQQIAENF